MSNSSAETDNSLSVTKIIEVIVPIGLILLLLVWCFNIIAPFIAPIVWGIVIAIGTYPMCQWFIKKTKLGNTLGTTLFTLLMILLLITPTIMLTGVLFDDAQKLSSNLQSGSLNIPGPPDVVGDLPIIGDDLKDFWTRASEDPK
ncbi:MAG: AI-2E family transporter, partial [Gammaproteobacteria bacterium]|nr:AI-2E family transporter [Gammaproteobacteria bacterium]